LENHTKHNPSINLVNIEELQNINKMALSRCNVMRTAAVVALVAAGNSNQAVEAKVFGRVKGFFQRRGSQQQETAEQQEMAAAMNVLGKDAEANINATAPEPLLAGDAEKLDTAQVEEEVDEKKKASTCWGRCLKRLSFRKKKAANAAEVEKKESTSSGQEKALVSEDEPQEAVAGEAVVEEQQAPVQEGDQAVAKQQPAVQQITTGEVVETAAPAVPDHC